MSSHAYIEDDISEEKVTIIKDRLAMMKKALSDRQAAAANSKNQSIDDILYNRPHKHASIIDANFLSFALCGALCVILTVAVYAFYSLYHAVLKKFPSQHTEL